MKSCLDLPFPVPGCPFATSYHSLFRFAFRIIYFAGDNRSYKPIEELTREDFLKVYDINVFGVMYGMKYAVPQMKKQGKGTIVNITSEGQFVAASGIAPYVSSKHAAGGLSKCVALEVAKDGIRVNTICPGAVDTPMMRHAQIRQVSEETAGLVQTGQLVIDYDCRLVTVAGKEIHLTQNEYKILSVLGKNIGKVMTYDSILKEQWGPTVSNNNQALRVHMANIRRKIEENPAEPKYVLTEFGIGYSMVELN